MVARVIEVSVPEGSLVAASLPRVDYSDAFRIELDLTRAIDVDGVVRAALATLPRWVVGAARVRDRVARGLGLKEAGPVGAMPEHFSVGDVVSIFRVFARSDREIVLGEDDRHLDFRAAFLLDGPGALVVSTVVAFHNALGRAYFVPVGLGHRAIVRAMMRATRDALSTGER